MAALKLIALLLEFLIQTKRRNDDEEKKIRVDAAKSDPLNYLRQFGRVQHVANDDNEQTKAMPDKRTEADKHSNE